MSSSALPPSVALGRVLVDELVRGGVTEAVVAPGSRSAPLAVALAEAADAGRLRLHVRIDERSAGFLALGLAKASGRPVPVVTTSGTATGSLHPAVLEADQAGVPLLVLTADRPPELRATGANQTVDQPGLFGAGVRLAHDLAVPTDQAREADYWRAVVCRALAAAAGVLTADPGPVHLNVPFREPLVAGGPTAAGTADVPRGRAGGAPWTSVVPPARQPVVADPPLPDRTLVVVGDAPPALGRAVVPWAEAQGWPVIAEPSGNARSGPAAVSTGAHLLGVPGLVDALLPERVVVVGRPTLSRPVLALLARDDVAVDVVSATARWADAGRRASRVWPGLPEPGERRPAAPEWLVRWQALEAAARSALDRALDGDPHATEPRLARDLVAALPAGALLVAGSSMPVRDLFLAAAPRDGVTVLANRGAAGIDGTVSTAWGAALAWQRGGGGPAVGLLGDLTALHDGTGLVRGPADDVPDLALVVVNNGGGGIFGLLEPARAVPVGLAAAAYERVFATPHGVDLAAWCGATQTPHTRATTVGEAVSAATDPRGGLHVVEVRTDRWATVEAQARLRQAVAEAVVPLL